MFKVRVIPCLDVKDGRVVKGVKFVDLRDAGDPVAAAIAYDAADGERHEAGFGGAPHHVEDDVAVLVAGGDVEERELVGAGEILLTSMDRDGTKQGFDIALTRAIADAVSVPVIASGGVGTLEHLVEGIRDGHATAVLAASIFHFGEFTIREAKDHMARRGLPMRLDA